MSVWCTQQLLLYFPLTAEALPPPCCVVASPCLKVEVDVFNSENKDNTRLSPYQATLAYMVTVRRTGVGSRQWRRET